MRHCVFVSPGISDLPRCSEQVVFLVAMIGHIDASSAHILLIVLTGASLLHLSNTNLINTHGIINNANTGTLHGLLLSEDGQEQDKKREPLQKEEEEGELFKDVDLKTLAAVLLESLNQSQVDRKIEAEDHDEMDENTKAEKWDVTKESTYRQERMMEGVDRDRDGHQELELLIIAQGKEQEKEDEKERKKALVDEEKMTEKVNSHITSHIIQTDNQPSSLEEGEKNKQHGPNIPEHDSNEEEEQLSPNELKSLETMMKEFPQVNIASKRDSDLEQKRESRSYSSFNDIVPLNKGNNLAMSKKKLKWQEETQKLLNVPTFRGNFMNDLNEDNHFAGSNAAQSEIPVEQGVVGDDDEQEGEDDDEEVLSPDEEEAQAKAEQEEMRRQAAEAQRAKMEEEKLADIASDMLLGYIGKQNNGNKKYSSSLTTAVEDKRSDEEGAEEDDIDPQTIDKLIEISSKLHLPADDVVDIISDVEKKKKQDMPSEQDSPWQQPLTPLSHPFSSTNSFLGTQISTNQNRIPISKQPSPAFNLLKTWFQGKSQTKLQDLWSNVARPLLNNWPKPKKPLSVKEFWFKSPKSSYLFNYQRKSYPGYHPIYFPPPPRAKPHFLIPKSAQAVNNYLWNSVDGPYTFLPKRRFPTWAHPQAQVHSLRQASTGLQQNSYSSYPLPLYPWTFQPVPIPRPHSPLLWRKPVRKPQQKQFYYSSIPWPLVENEDYYMPEKQRSRKT